MEAIALGSELDLLMREWRRDIHAHPETAYEEHRTAGKIVQLLESFGLDVCTGLGVTGVVATLKGDRPGCRSIGLRADIDALNVQELNDFEHRSHHQGKMHACGHDGHTATLLGAAKYLSENRDFAGTVVFIFQPAEEGEAGAKAMCDDGLFDKFNVDAVYGMHNWPGIEQGKFAVHSGAVMASLDVFDITIKGQGCHAGMPHLGTDPILVASQLIGALQSVVSRNLDPLSSGVISITKMLGGEAYNVIPDSVTLSGTCRAFSTEQQDQIESLMRQRVKSICEAFSAEGALDYRRIAPSTVNHLQQAKICRAVTTALVGESNVLLDPAPSMGAEDFAFMLLKKPGAYIWIGNGVIKDGEGLHNPHYDFNDDILSLGANYWIALTQQHLA
ncbi:amidohydrolase [Psychromonas sp. MB-3u-54]|uniref:M20 aminoacylase family protein n=1 Tax=Psychromonas sp. MB-3u-54 TaxID=2058319 RepID=UPI000C33DE53|nr:M20 aminoacylase family protein [Psychromonas sp. MB-3u-54]PKH03795.1 amidohydrolase [Psychromonas sp. MB-3u-54]